MLLGCLLLHTVQCLTNYDAGATSFDNTSFDNCNALKVSSDTSKAAQVPALHMQRVMQCGTTCGCVF